MPIYEYQCQSCGHRLEALQKLNEEPLKECPKCHQATLTKLISAAGFQLKGTGWYVTDFKDKNKKPADKTKEEKSDSGSSTDAKTDTKTDTGKTDTGSGGKTDKGGD